jgi:hypothetical protein
MTTVGAGGRVGALAPRARRHSAGSDHRRIGGRSGGHWRTVAHTTEHTDRASTDHVPLAAGVAFFGLLALIHVSVMTGGGCADDGCRA